MTKRRKKEKKVPASYTPLTANEHDLSIFLVQSFDYIKHLSKNTRDRDTHTQRERERERERKKEGERQR